MKLHKMNGRWLECGGRMIYSNLFASQSSIVFVKTKSGCYPVGKSGQVNRKWKYGNGNPEKELVRNNDKRRNKNERNNYSV